MGAAKSFGKAAGNVIERGFAAIAKAADEIAAGVKKADAAAIGPKAPKNAVPPYAGRKCSGTFIRPDGTEVPLVSGRAGPASSMPRGTPGMNGRIKTHVEAHTAAIMRQEELTEGTLWINRLPCPDINGSKGCETMLERMVPEGSTLTVHVVENGSVDSLVVETIRVIGKA